MSLELALRLGEWLIALAVLQSSLEHLSLGHNRAIYASRLLCAVMVMIGWPVGPALIGLWVLSTAALIHFNGPYNGGADKMVFLGLTCLTVAYWVPQWAELALAYWAVQLVLSYVVSGWVKVKNPDWRSGQALRDVFAFSAYPACETYRDLAARPALLAFASKGVMLFELCFPISLISPVFVLLALGCAAAFHIANAVLFGLNRFVWAWLSAFPSLIWLQERIFG